VVSFTPIVVVATHSPNHSIDAILTVSQDNTSVLSDVDLESLVASQRAGGKLASALRSVNVESIGVFEFLLVTPAESLTRSFATIMSRRALVLDILLEEKRITADNTFRWHGQLVLRSFLLRFVSLTDDTTVRILFHILLLLTTFGIRCRSSWHRI
jgi:hypothetical protein